MNTLSLSQSRAPVLATWFSPVLAVGTALLKATVFTGAGMADTLVFLACLSSLFFASDRDVAPAVRRFVFVFVLAGVVPYFGMANTFYLDVVTQVAIFAALAVGLNIVVGFAGLLDLGYVAFFAVGAYLWAILGSPQALELFGAGSSFLPLPANAFFPCLLLAVGAAAAIGVLLGLPVLRLRGDYLAIVTLGFGEVIRILANNLDRPVNITNGPQGIASIGQPLEGLALWLAGFGAEAFKWQAFIYYALVIAILALAVRSVSNLNHSRIGRAWIAIREDEIAAQAMGVPLTRTKLIAFASGASFAGAMGMIFAAKQTFVSPESFDLNQSIGILSMVVLGGLGSIRGAILGAALVTVLNLQLLKAFSAWFNDLRTAGVEILGWSLAQLPAQFDPAKYERLIFGLILILMMLYRPAGLVPSRRRAIELAEPAPEFEDRSFGLAEADLPRGKRNVRKGKA